MTMKGDMPQVPHPGEIAFWLLAMARSLGSRHIEFICRDAAMADAWEALLVLVVVPIEITVKIHVGHGDMSLKEDLDLRALPAYTSRIVRVGPRTSPSDDGVTQEQAAETAAAAVASTWMDVAHIQDQVRDPRRWLLKLIGFQDYDVRGLGPDEELGRVAEQMITKAAIALCMVRESSRTASQSQQGNRDDDT
jgi:hypothetical protein